MIFWYLVLLSAALVALVGYQLGLVPGIVLGGLLGGVLAVAEDHLFGGG